MDFAQKLIDWYRIHKRDLPWRSTNDPYCIWVSEVILQQTRVQQGTGYYLRFLDQFPTIFDLAKASQEKVLKLWQGLGYYNRALNMHETAKRLVSNNNGEFPSSYDELLKLKGIGEYTAAAIASICFAAPTPVIDGNVYRVLARIFNLHEPIDTTTGKHAFRKLAETLIDPEAPGDYNQALMEFGATCCTPKSPDCGTCVFKPECIANEQDIVALLPIKAKKIKVRNRYFNYLVIRKNNWIYWKKRTEKDIWKNLYDFPLVETTHAVNYDVLCKQTAYQKIIGKSKCQLVGESIEYKHQLTHQKIHAKFWHFELFDAIPSQVSTSEIAIAAMHELAIPKLIHNYLKNEWEIQNLKHLNRE